MSDETFNCQYCARTFDTLIGLGVHKRIKHKDEVDAENAREDKKARWSEEEIRRMAVKEAELLHQKVRFINQELVKYFTSRTVESIKGARRKPEYKRMVEDHLRILTSSSSLPIHPPTDVQLDNIPEDNTILDYIRSLPPMRGAHSETLNNIIAEAIAVGKEVTLARLSNLLLEIFPTTGNNNRSQASCRNRMPKNRSEKRRQEYAKTQKFWSKNSGRCINQILDGVNNSKMPDRNVMEPYWTNVLSEHHAVDIEALRKEPESMVQRLWSCIEEKEVKRFTPMGSSAPGPDGITPRKYRALPVELTTRLINLIMWCGQLPEQTAVARTTFIPKKDISVAPEDFRPITIPSVIVRHLHSIFADRLRNLVKINEHQRGFIQSDGCADNVSLLDLVLRYHHKAIKSVYICAIDVSKAFDTVSHEALLAILKNYGIPEGMTSYLEKYYKTSSTILQGGDWSSEKITPRRGVKQGDPLSPLLFNLVVDSVISKLPETIGAMIDGCRINVVAFADDILLFAQTREGLQELMGSADAELKKYGLKINSAKSVSIGIKAIGKTKKTMIDSKPFLIDGREVPALKRTDTWRYLGVEFSPEGRTLFRAAETITPLLEKLTSAPLKPQQRMFALRTVLIPRLYHQTTLGRIHLNCLKKLDKIVRRYIRTWMKLPHDLPIAFVHANVKDGGLGIPSFRLVAPLLRLRKLERLFNHLQDENQVFDTFIKEEKENCRKRLLLDNNTLFDTARKQQELWKSRISNMVDGKGLKESSKVPQAHRWITEPTKLLSGQDYLECVKLKFNALPSRSRTSRGRNARDRNCRAGCSAIETTNHILQQCHRTHGTRVKRHDGLVNYLQRSLEQKGFHVQKEHQIETEQGIRKPDLITWKNNKVLLVDVQVVTDSFDLSTAHRAKVVKYSTPEVLRHMETTSQASEVKVSSLTLNWRGIMCKDSVEDLLEFGVITKRDIAVLAVRALVGGIISFKTFNRSTRVGIG